jgi:hypothetical protein
MRRGVAQYLVGSVVLLTLSGCGLFVFEKRAAWRDEAEQACLSAKAVQVTAYVESAREISGPGACGMLQPFRVAAFGEGSVGLSSKATLACPMVSRTDQWIAEVVQPAAQLYWGTAVTGLKAGSYSCRGVNNRQGGPKSEHAFGNAMDVMSSRSPMGARSASSAAGAGARRSRSSCARSSSIPVATSRPCWRRARTCSTTTTSISTSPATAAEGGSASR